jgi:hypothetical protein
VRHDIVLPSLQYDGNHPAIPTDDICMEVDDNEGISIFKAVVWWPVLD